MRKLVMAMMVFCAASQAFALTPLGPPRAGLKQNQHSLGFIFASSEMDFKMSGYGESWSATDIESKTYLARLSTGVSDNLEFYTLLGISDATADDFDGSSEFAWGLGTKFTVAEKDSVTWGGLFQIVSINSEGTMSGDTPDFGWQTMDVDVQLLEIQIAVGPTYTQESFSIYGGPFLHFVDGDFDCNPLGVSITFDIEQKSEFGGYVGAQFDLAESSSLFIEYQMTGDASAIAGGIVWRF